jgi:hypothetical protein
MMIELSKGKLLKKDLLESFNSTRGNIKNPAARPQGS